MLCGSSFISKYCFHNDLEYMLIKLLIKCLLEINLNSLQIHLSLTYNMFIYVKNKDSQNC